MNTKVVKHSYKKSIIVYVLLGAIVLLGFFLRTLVLPDNMLFGYEQGRDALVVKEILGGNFTLLGPKTDIEGIYHGVGYYYWLSFVYSITQGDPGNAIVLFAAVNALTSIIVFFIARNIIGRTRYALLAAAMAAVSFDIIVYGRWLSNVSLSIPLVGLFFYSLTKLVKTKNPNYWVLVGLTSGILSHFELLHILYAVFVTITSINIFSLPTKNKQFFIGIAVFLLANASFVVFDLRHEFLITNAVIHYLTSQSLSANPMTVIYEFINGLVNNMVSSLFAKNGVLILLFMIVLSVLSVKKKIHHEESFRLILLFVLFSFPYIFLLKFSPLEHFFAGTAIAWILIFNYMLFRLENRISRYALAGIYIFLIVASALYVQLSLTHRTGIFYHSVQQSYIYKDQLAAWDYMFTHAGNGFTYEAFTIPYYHQEAWNYLYDWYGAQKYPEVYAMNKKEGTKDKMFLIIEPSTKGLHLTKWLKSFDKKTVLVTSVKFGGIEIQERRVITVDNSSQKQ